MERRTFLKGVVALPAGNVIGGSGGALFGDVSNEDLAVRTIKDLGNTRLSAQKSAREFSVDAARPIAEVYEEVKRETAALMPDGVAHIFDIENLSASVGLSIRYFRPLYKFMDVVERAHGVELPVSRLYRALYVLGNISAIGGLLIALKNVGETCLKITQTVTQDSESAVSDEQHKQFYFSNFLLATELVFLAVPINVRLAWRGTRWATNRLLFRIRRLHYGDEILAMVMSFVHWVIRDIPREATGNADNVLGLFQFVVSELQTRAEEVPGATAPSAGEIESFTRQMYTEHLEGELGTVDLI